jgi:hypothetical protein
MSHQLHVHAQSNFQYLYSSRLPHCGGSRSSWTHKNISFAHSPEYIDFASYLERELSAGPRGRQVYLSRYPLVVRTWWWEVT